MLKDEVALYSKLTGKDGLNVPVGIIGAYLDGYERGKADAQPERIRGRWIPSDTDGFVCSVCRNGYRNQPTLMEKPMFEFCPVCGAEMEVTT